MTSKPDNPPPYEDALHHPKYDNCPQQSQPPPPSYSAIPGTFPSPPGYWGQAGTWAGPAFSPAGVPATVPTLSAGVPAANTGCAEKGQDLISAQLSPMFELVAVSQLCRRHGGCSAQPVGEHVCSPRLHQKGKDLPPSAFHAMAQLCFGVFLGGPVAKNILFSSAQTTCAALSCEVSDSLLFVLQVYMILAAQLAVTISVVAVFTFV